MLAVHHVAPNNICTTERKARNFCVKTFFSYLVHFVYSSSHERRKRKIKTSKTTWRCLMHASSLTAQRFLIARNKTSPGYVPMFSMCARFWRFRARISARSIAVRWFPVVPFYEKPLTIAWNRYRKINSTVAIDIKYIVSFSRTHARYSRRESKRYFTARVKY